MWEGSRGARDDSRKEISEDELTMASEQPCKLLVKRDCFVREALYVTDSHGDKSLKNLNRLMAETGGGSNGRGLPLGSLCAVEM